MMKLASRLEEQGQTNMAFKLYGEILQKEPYYKPAIERYVALKDQSGQSPAIAHESETMLAAKPTQKQIEDLIAKEVERRLAENQALAKQLADKAATTKPQSEFELASLSRSESSSQAEMQAFLSASNETKSESTSSNVMTPQINPGFGFTPKNTAHVVASRPQPSVSPFGSAASGSADEMDAAFALDSTESVSNHQSPVRNETAETEVPFVSKDDVNDATFVADSHDEQQLLQQLASDDESLKIDALVKLAECCQNSEVLLDSIDQHTSDSSDTVLAYASWTLGKVTHQPDLAAEDLADFLCSDDAHAQQSAAYLLGLLGEHAVPYTEDLEEELSTSDELTRLHMAEALIRLNPDHEKAIEAVLELSSSNDNSIRCLATHVLSDIDPVKHPKTMASLSMKLNDTDPSIRSAAALALGGYGEKAETAIPALLETTNDRDHDVRLAANTALSCIMDEVTSH